MLLVQKIILMTNILYYVYICILCTPMYIVGGKWYVYINEKRVIIETLAIVYT